MFDSLIPSKGLRQQLKILIINPSNNLEYLITEMVSIKALHQDQILIAMV